MHQGRIVERTVPNQFDRPVDRIAFADAPEVDVDAFTIKSDCRVASEDSSRRSCQPVQALAQARATSSGTRFGPLTKPHTSESAPR